MKVDMIPNCTLLPKDNIDLMINYVYVRSIAKLTRRRV
jgi:hypothetical protein